MRFDLDRLVATETLTLRPRAGGFDVAAVFAALDGIGSPWRDPDHPQRLLLSADAAGRDAIAAERAADPTAPYPRVVDLDIRADRIVLWPAGYHPAFAAIARTVLERLLALTDCTVVDEDDRDMATEAAGP